MNTAVRWKTAYVSRWRFSRQYGEAVSENIAVGVRLRRQTGWMAVGIRRNPSSLASSEALGCDYIHVSSGGLSPQAIQVGPGYQLPFAPEIRQQINVPVIGVGVNYRTAAG